MLQGKRTKPTNTQIGKFDGVFSVQLVVAPLRRSGALNLTVLLCSFVILTLAVILWPITYWVRRHYQRSPGPNQGPRTMLRVAALFDLLWLAAWCIVLTPVLSI